MKASTQNDISRFLFTSLYSYQPLLLIVNLTSYRPHTLIATSHTISSATCVISMPTPLQKPWNIVLTSHASGNHGLLCDTLVITDERSRCPYPWFAAPANILARHLILSPNERAPDDKLNFAILSQPSHRHKQVLKTFCALDGNLGRSYQR